MTVEDIKEYIRKMEYGMNYREFEQNKLELLSMLDELGDIKEYINKRIKECDEEYENHDRIYGLCLDHRDVSNELEKVKDMLDELEENNK